MKRVALVTGSAGGIGLATAEAFAVAGWEVIGVDRRAQETLSDGVRFWQADLSEPKAAESLVERIEREVGRLDALVNNAAIQIVKPILETSLDEWDNVQQVNLRMIFDLSRRSHRLLKATRGAIVNVSSVHALATSKSMAAYAASKGGLLALTRSMALEFGSEGIRVNAILPGAVDTAMLREAMERGRYEGNLPEERLAALAERTALGRVGDPREIADAILFLADGRQSSFITGQSLVVDGGALARLSTE